jgi:hypothetical protein
LTKIRVGSEYTPPENAYVGDDGTFPVVLYAIGEPRDTDGVYGPKVVQEWQFAINDPASPFNGQLLFDSWVTAPRDGVVHPKSNYFQNLTALFGGRAAPEGTEIDIEKYLIGAPALVTVARQENGSVRITNLGAMPSGAPAAQPAPVAAPVAAPSSAPAVAAPPQPLREQVASPDLSGNLPF